MTKETIDPVIQAPKADGYSLSDDIKSSRLEVISTAKDEINITEPSSPNHSEFLYNKIEKSLSGHVKEVDDTPGAERVMEMHKSGTFYEIHPDGTKVIRIYGDDFHISLQDRNLVVGGNLNITVQGDANILTKGNVTQKIGGNYDLVVHGNMTTRVHGSRLDYTKKNHDIQTYKNFYIRSEESTILYSNEILNFQSKDNMILKTSAKAQIHSESSFKLTTASTFQLRSDSQMNLNSGSNVYIDGSSVRLNDPGSTISILNIKTNDPEDKDPTGGLIVAESVTEPSLQNIKFLKTGNHSILSFLETNLTFPKDRTFIDSSE